MLNQSLSLWFLGFCQFTVSMQSVTARLYGRHTGRWIHSLSPKVPVSRMMAMGTRRSREKILSNLLILQFKWQRLQGVVTLHMNGLFLHYHCNLQWVWTSLPSSVKWTSDDHREHLPGASYMPDTVLSNSPNTAINCIWLPSMREENINTQEA